MWCDADDGTPVQWNEGMSLTVSKTVAKKGKGKKGGSENAGPTKTKTCPSFFDLFRPTLSGLKRPAEALDMDPSMDLLAASHEKARARAGKLVVEHFEILTALRQVQLHTDTKPLIRPFTTGELHSPPKFSPMPEKCRR
eukprot:2903989-Pyramimonas_sp.AAC.1